MEKEITIYDIAKEVNVSAATVSRALSDHSGISNKTKKLVHAKAEELGYQSNKFATNLRQKRTYTIGVIVPRLNSYFMSTVLAGMEKVANDAGYNLIISQSLESEKKEVANVKTMFNSRVDALLASIAYDTEGANHFQPFFKKNIPVLFFDRVIDCTNCTSVVIGNLKAGYEATLHLIEQGCKSIGHITGNMKRNVYTDRFRGYKMALQEAGIPFDSELVFETDLSIEASNYCINTLLRKSALPDGLFIANDMCAVGCIHTLKKANIKVPKDIAIVGFNDDNITTIIEPTLTTIHYPGKEMGEVAIQTIINCLEGTLNIQKTNKIILTSELIIRESSLFHQNL